VNVGEKLVSGVGEEEKGTKRNKTEFQILSRLYVGESDRKEAEEKRKKEDKSKDEVKSREKHTVPT